MKTLLLATLVSAVFTPANGQTPDSAHQLVIHLYNLSGMPQDTLHRATREASRIFAQADVNVVWTPAIPKPRKPTRLTKVPPPRFATFTYALTSSSVSAAAWPFTSLRALSDSPCLTPSSASAPPFFRKESKASARAPASTSQPCSDMPSPTNSAT